MKDITDYNRRAWDSFVERRDQWTIPVGPGVIESARRRDWKIVLTPTKPVPASWFPPLTAFRVLQPGGVLLAGFINPAAYIFDDGLADQGVSRLVKEMVHLNRGVASSRSPTMPPQFTSRTTTNAGVYAAVTRRGRIAVGQAIFFEPSITQEEPR